MMEGMYTLFTNPELRKTLGSNGKRLVKKMYTGEEVVNDFESIFFTYIASKHEIHKVRDFVRKSTVEFDGNSMIIEYSCSTIHPVIKATAVSICGSKFLECIDDLNFKLKGHCEYTKKLIGVLKVDFEEDIIHLNVNIGPKTETLKISPFENIETRVVSFCTEFKINGPDCQTIYNSFVWGPEVRYKQRIQALAGDNKINLW